MEKSTKLFTELLNEIIDGAKNQKKKSVPSIKYAKCILYNVDLESLIMQNYTPPEYNDFYPVPYLFLVWMKSNVKDFKMFLNSVVKNMEHHHMFTKYETEYTHFGNCMVLDLEWSTLELSPLSEELSEKDIRYLEQMCTPLPMINLPRHISCCDCRDCLGFDVNDLYEMNNMERITEPGESNIDASGFIKI
jgi:hypothetical protein